jgi:hypothetical protein
MQGFQAILNKKNEDHSPFSVCDSCNFCDSGNNIQIIAIITISLNIEDGFNSLLTLTTYQCF